MIEINDLSKIYKIPEKESGIRNSIKSFFNRKYLEIEAVKNVSFKIEDSEIVGLIGLNGAGKTTILKTLSGLIKPTSGSVKVLGHNPWDKENNFLKKIGFLAGNKSQLSWDIPSMDSYILESKIYGIDKEEFNKTFEELVTLLDVRKLLNIPVRKLSLGQRMKMELILTLLHKPKVLFLDEPTLGLDIISQKNIRNFLCEYRKKEKATIIITSHNMKDIEDICDKIIIIDKGTVIYNGSIKKLKENYNDIKLIRIKYEEDSFLNKLENLLKEKTYGIETQGSNTILLKINSKDILVFKSKILEMNEIIEISFEDISFEDILNILLKGERL